MASRGWRVWAARVAVVLFVGFVPSRSALADPVVAPTSLRDLTKGIPRGSQVMWNTAELNARLGTKHNAVEATIALKAAGFVPLSDVGVKPSAPWTAAGNINSAATAASRGWVFDLTPNANRLGAHGGAAVGTVEAGMMKGETGTNARGVAVYRNGAPMPAGFAPAKLPQRLPAIGTGDKIGFPLPSAPGESGKPLGLVEPPAPCAKPTAPPKPGAFSKAIGSLYGVAEEHARAAKSVGRTVRGTKMPGAVGNTATTGAGAIMAIAGISDRYRRNVTEELASVNDAALQKAMFTWAEEKNPSMFQDTLAPPASGNPDTRHERRGEYGRDWVYYFSTPEEIRSALEEEKQNSNSPLHPGEKMQKLGRRAFDTYIEGRFVQQTGFQPPATIVQRNRKVTGSNLTFDDVMVKKSDGTAEFYNVSFRGYKRVDFMSTPALAKLRSLAAYEQAAKARGETVAEMPELFRGRKLTSIEALPPMPLDDLAAFEQLEK